MVLLQTADVEYTGNDRIIAANTLFDLGSDHSYITEATARFLRLSPVRYQQVNMAVFGSIVTEQLELPIVVAHMTLPNQHHTIQLQLRVVPLISTNNQNYDRSVLINKHAYLRDIQLVKQCVGNTYDIHVLIGADHFWDIATDKIIRGSGPICIGTHLGYLLSGPTHSIRSTVDPTSTVMKVICSEAEITNLANYWNLESIGLDSDDDGNSFDIEHYSDTCIEYKNGRYIASLPWKKDHPPLPTNYSIAAHITRQLARNMTAHKREQYSKLIKDQLEKQFIEIPTADDPLSGHYLCHYAIEKQSTTTPLRIVYRCNFSTGQNPSLNDCLEPGTSIQPDIAAIILRFRLYKTAILADVEKAFLRVVLHPKDRQYVKFLWLEDPTNPESHLRTYNFCAPYLGPYVLRSY
jgi:hypothetical protein